MAASTATNMSPDMTSFITSALPRTKCAGDIVEKGMEGPHVLGAVGLSDVGTEALGMRLTGADKTW